jgi:hypothetical protein
MEDPQWGQLEPSRSKGPLGRGHSPPQTLQMNFPESEHVKRRPPILIVDGLDKLLFPSMVSGGGFNSLP